MIDLPLHTSRLVIRRFEAKDLDAYLRFMLDEDSTRFLAFAAEQKTDEGARALFDAVVKSYETPEAIHAYAVADRETDQYRGSCGFAPYCKGVVECYYCVNAEFRRRGIAVEAVQAILPALAATAEVRAYCHPENAAAHAVAERCGMQQRGVDRHLNTGLEGACFVYDRT